ncbi:MAG: FkbM family methyltransferase [Minisyncoccia bacterium]
MEFKKYYKAAKVIHKYLEIPYTRLIRYYIFERNKLLSININNNKIDVRFQDLYDIGALIKEGWTVIQISQNLITFQSPNNAIITWRAGIGYDISHLVEIYLDEIYGSGFKNKNVIDIGMSNGDSSIYFAKEGSERVIGLEPDKRSFDLALKNIKESQVDNIVLPLNKALSDQTGIIELIVYDSNPNANSVDEINMVKLKDSKFKERVEAITLKEIIDMFNGENIDLLKMDCEGCEYKVLRTLPQEYFSKILNIILEYHNGLQDIPEILKKQGFNIKISESNNFMGIITASKNIINL